MIFQDDKYSYEVGELFKVETAVNGEVVGEMTYRVAGKVPHTEGRTQYFLETIMYVGKVTDYRPANPARPNPLARNIGKP